MRSGTAFCCRMLLLLVTTVYTIAQCRADSNPRFVPDVLTVKPGSKVVSLTITRPVGSASAGQTVKLLPIAGSAQPGTDFDGRALTVALAAGQHSKAVNVSLTGTLHALNTTFAVLLQSGAGEWLGPGTQAVALVMLTGTRDQVSTAGQPPAKSPLHCLADEPVQRPHCYIACNSSAAGILHDVFNVTWRPWWLQSIESRHICAEYVGLPSMATSLLLPTTLTGLSFTQADWVWWLQYALQAALAEAYTSADPKLAPIVTTDTVALPGCPYLPGSPCSSSHSSCVEAIVRITLPSVPLTEHAVVVPAAAVAAAVAAKLSSMTGYALTLSLAPVAPPVDWSMQNSSQVLAVVLVIIGGSIGLVLCIIGFKVVQGRTSARTAPEKELVNVGLDEPALKGSQWLHTGNSVRQIMIPADGPDYKVSLVGGSPGLSPDLIHHPVSTAWGSSPNLMASFNPAASHEGFAPGIAQQLPDPLWTSTGKQL